jgi:ABC-type multidrug transport system fused ATPase/permease subunit
LAIARELFKQPDILILDEATSSLDSQSESYIQQSMERLRGALTIIIISHRLSTIRHVDYIYVIEQGRIIEYGTFSELSGLQVPHFDGCVSFSVWNRRSRVRCESATDSNEGNS